MKVSPLLLLFLAASSLPALHASEATPVSAQSEAMDATKAADALDREDAQRISRLEQQGSEAVAAELNRLRAEAKELSEADTRLLIKLLRWEGYTEEAGAALAEAVRRFPESLPIARFEVAYRRDLQQREKAIEAIHRQVRLEPGAVGRLKRAEVLLWNALGENDKAAEVAKEVVAADPENPGAHRFLVHARRRAKRFDESREASREAIRLSKDPYDNLRQLAEMELAQGHADAALEIIREAREKAGSQHHRDEATRWMLPFYDRKGQLSEWLASMEKEVENDWRQALYLSSAYRELGRSFDARAALARIEKEHGDDPDFLDQLQRISQFPEDLKAAERLVALEPTADRRLALARRLHGGQFVGMAEQLQTLLTEQAEAIKADPYRWTTIYFRLPARLRTEALNTLFRTALEARQSDLRGKLRLAEYLLVHRQDDAAEVLLREVAYATPDTGSALDRTTSLTGRIRSAPAQLTAYYRLRREGLDRYEDFPEMKDEKLNDEARRTRALVFLAALAAERGAAKEFVGTLEEELAPLPWRERVAALAAVGAYEPLARELSAGLASPHRTPADLQVVVRTLVAAERLRVTPELRAALAHAVLDDVKARGGSGEWITAVHGLLVRLQEREAAETVATHWLASEEAKTPRSVEAAIRLAAQRDDIGLMEELIRARTSSAPLPTALYYEVLDSFARAGHPEKVVEMALAFYQTLNPDQPHPYPYIPLYVVRDYQYPRFPKTLTGFDRGNELEGTIQRLTRQPKAAALFEQKMKALAYQDAAAAHRHQLALVHVAWHCGKQEETLRALRKLADTPSNGDEMWLLIAHLEAKKGKSDETLAALKQARFQELQAYDQILQTLYDASPGSAQDKEKQRILAARAGRPMLSMNHLTSVLYRLKEAQMTAEAAPLVKRIAENARSTTPDLTAASNQLQQLQATPNQEEAAVTLAQRILDEPPVLMVANLYDSSQRTGALRALGSGKKLTAYIADLEQQAASEPLTLSVGLRLAEAYRVNEQFAKLPPLYRRLLELEPGNGTLRARLAEALARQNAQEGTEFYLQLMCDLSPRTLTQEGHQVIDFFERHKQLHRLGEYIQSLTPENFGDPLRVPVSFFRSLADRLQQHHSEDARKVREKGISLALPGSREATGLELDLIQRSLNDKETEALRQRLLDYFTASKSKDVLFAFSRENTGMLPFLNPPSQPSDGVYRLPEFTLLKKAIQLGLEDQLLAIARENPISEPYLSQLIRLAALDRSVLKELEATGSSLVPSRTYHTAVLLAAAHESANWPQIGNTPLLLLAAAKRSLGRDDEWNRQSFVRQELRIARKLNNPQVIDAAFQRWYEFYRDNPSMLNHVDSSELCEVGLRMLEVKKAEQAARLLAMAKTRAGHHHGNEAITRLESLITATSGKFDNMQAIVTLLSAPADGEEESTLFWSLSPGTAIAPNERQQAPLIPGSTPALLDGKFDLELLHLAPPNTVRHLALLKGVKASGVWKGKLPAMTGGLGARLISGKSRFEGQWTDYAIGTNLLTPPGDHERWTTIEGGPLTESVERLFPESPAWTPAQTDKQHKATSARLKLKAGQRYFVSAWFYRASNRASLSLHLRGYDANGEPIDDQWLGRNLRNDGGWQYIAREIAPASRQSGDFVRIPDRAKEIAIELRISGEAVVTNLQLVELPDEEKVE